MIQTNPDYVPYRENIDKFLSFEEEIHVDKFLAKYLEDRCYVIDQVTKKERLPTGPSFNNTVSYIKRHVIQKLNRKIDVDDLNIFNSTKKKVISDIRLNGQICANTTRGITTHDREIIDQLHSKIRLKYFTNPNFRPKIYFS